MNRSGPAEAGAPVVVGADGSPPSLVAVALAADLAARRARTLRVVHAFIWPEFAVPLDASPQGPPEGGLANDARRTLEAAIAHGRKARPGLDITGEIVTGAAAPVLLNESRHAAMVVLGNRGLGGFTGLLVGSVAVQVAAHASCPVVVARDGIARDGDILVGVDGSAGGGAALDFAFEEASLRGVGVTALHAFFDPVAGVRGEHLALVYDVQQLRTDEAAVLAEAVAGRAERYPDVTLHQVVVRDHAARALIHATRDASLVVVASRGLGGFLGLILGSVSHALLHHADCPVAIVH